MDIFNRPPAISDDTLQYSLHPSTDFSDRTSVTSFAACIASFVDSLLTGFLWHRDAFELNVVSDPDVKNGWMLEGTMRVGDCVDDEWCVVWLLKEISARWDLAISTYDSDGEFLLIEAAEALPKWVTPSNSENRVWIYGSRLHLIPVSHISPPSRKRRRRTALKTQDSDDEGGIGGNNDDSNEEFIAMEDALKLIRDPSEETLAPAEVESLVWRRISGYPATVKEHVHTTKAWLPVDIARALTVNPSLVQKPVETFYTRDAVQLRAAHRMSRFPPEPSILATVKMTRTAYAQLVGQKFYPPKIFGRWTDKEGTRQWRWKDVGMKLACGFEMLYQENKDAVIPDSSAEAYLRIARSKPDYAKFIDNLKSTSYFKGELEGSALWQQLEAKAAETYVQSAAEQSRYRPSYATLVEQALSRAPKTLTPGDSEEDSEDWLNIDADDFDQMLERTMGTGSTGTSHRTEGAAMDVDGTTAEDRLASEQASKLRSLASKVQQFVEGQGDLEGARFADEGSSDGSDDDNEFSDGMPSTDSDDEDDVDESDIKDKMKDKDNLEDGNARRAAMDNLVPGIDPADYGKMPPSFHSNSQRVKPTAIESDTVADSGGDGDTRAGADGRIRIGDVKTDWDDMEYERGRDEASGNYQADNKGKAPQSPNSKPVRQPILPRNQYDGVVDSDDETDEEEDEEDEEDQPQLVGEIEVDMDEEEAEFLEFAREALGISGEQWGEIIQDRRDRGAFIPASAKDVKPISTTNRSEQTSGSAPQIQTTPRVPAPSLRPNVNPDLDSFEAVMQAMDAQLLSHSRNKPATPQTHAANSNKSSSSKVDNKGKGKARAEVASRVDVEDMEDIQQGKEDGDEIENIEQVMEAELKAALEDGEDMDWSAEGAVDYNMIKNFLASFQSQAGLSGPVGNLAGRLQHGWMPRDEA